MPSEPYPSEVEELEAERANGDRLAAALSIMVCYLRKEDSESLRATVVGPFLKDPVGQLTVGHVIDGASALHRQVVERRVY